MPWIQGNICPAPHSLLGAYTMSCTLWPGLQLKSSGREPTLALLASLCSCRLVFWCTPAPGKSLPLLSAHCWERISKEDNGEFWIGKSSVMYIVSSSSFSVYHLVILSAMGSLEQVSLIKLKLFILTIQFTSSQHYPFTSCLGAYFHQ